MKQKELDQLQEKALAQLKS